MNWQLLNHPIAMVLIIALTFGCSMQPSSKKSANSDPVGNPTGQNPESNEEGPEEVVASDNDPAPNPGGEEEGNIAIKDIYVSLGLRSFEQINETFAALTGIDPNTPIPGDPNNRTIADIFRELSIQLPTTNDIKAFLASHQVAISKLAVEYCDVLMADTTKRSALLPGFNFTLAPAQAFTPANNSMIAEKLIAKFWSDDLAKLPDGDKIKQVLTTLITEILNNVGPAATTVNVLKGVCTSVLSSAAVSIF